MDIKKILFVLSFLTIGIVDMWRQNYIDKVEEHEWVGFNWPTFEAKLKEAFIDKRLVQKALDKLHSMKLGKLHAEEFFAKFDILHRACIYVGAAYDQSLIRILRGTMPERIQDRIDYHIP
jgi:hypothetical protein